MTHKHNNDFERALHALRDDEPSAQELRRAGGRVWQHMQGAAEQPELIQGCDDVRRLLTAYSAGELPRGRELVIAAHLRECLGCRQQAEGRSPAVDWTPAVPRTARIAWPRFALSAAMVALLVVGTLLIYNIYFAVPAGARATVHDLDGAAFRIADQLERRLSVGDPIEEGELLRTAAGAHTVLKLSDGSLVEVNERSEFAMSARGRDMTIALNRGAVIVEAAKRRSGRLYVQTPDCRVAVTGTVFSVTSGMKGSRISVVEGAVRVKHLGETNELAAGEQLTTNENLAEVPVAEDIAWSRDLDKHLQVLAGLGQLKRQLEQVQLPAPRYSSRLLERMPADAIFYASLPNAGQALEEAHRILQTQIEQSPALREWWGGGNAEAQARVDETIRKLRQLSDYLGEEIVIVGLPGTKDNGVAIVAEVRDSGLREFLASQFSTGDQKLVVISDEQVATMPENSRTPVALARDNEVVFSVTRGAFQRVVRGLNGDGGLAETDFGRRIAAAYTRGTGLLIAADLQRLTQSSQKSQTARRNPRPDVPTGFENMRYLIAEHRELNGQPENRLALEFAGPRRGIPSWLGPPAPMASLEFVSRNAAVAVAFIAKDPELMLTDILTTTAREDRGAQRHLAEMEASLNIRLREDLAAHFGGDAVIALDGPVVPTPSWKAVIEVNNPAALADSLARLVQGMDAESKRHGGAGVELLTDDVSGQRFYHVRDRRRNDGPHYTFVAGYMIVGPTRAVLMNTIRTRVTGDSLARSGNFKALLPSDGNPNYSAIAYQNLAPILQPLLGQVSGETADAVRQLAADSRPTVVVARGAEDRIEAVGTSRLTAFDWFALARLLDSGTSKRQSP